MKEGTKVIAFTAGAFVAAGAFVVIGESLWARELMRDQEKGGKR